MSFRAPRALAGLALALALAGCDPEDRRPGLWLTGEPASALPADWRFTDAHEEIAIEVRTPYLVRHSVTIWCAQVDGALFVAARAPDEKNWPGWVAEDPNVRLKIGDDVYAAALARLTAPNDIAPVQAAYAAKYGLDPDAMRPAEVRYWRVVPAQVDA